MTLPTRQIYRAKRVPGWMHVVCVAALWAAALAACRSSPIGVGTRRIEGGEVRHSGVYIANVDYKNDHNDGVTLLVLQEGGTFNWSDVRKVDASSAASPRVVRGTWEQSGNVVRLHTPVFGLELRSTDAGLLMPSAEGDVLLRRVMPERPLDSGRGER